MIGGIVPTYVCDTLGAPFRVELVNSVVAGHDSVTIPDFDGMIATVAIERLHESRRLGGPDIVFLRKCAGDTADTLAARTGIPMPELEAYERGDRPMSATAEKITRIYLHHSVRAGHPAAEDDRLEYLETVLEWRPMPVSAGETVMRLAHQSARGWHRIA